MKEVTYVLMGHIEDTKTRSRVYLQGVTITGTPLQVATLFENLRERPGRVDVSVRSDSDEGVFRIGEDTLKVVRSAQETADVYDDPDKTDEDVIRISKLPSRWKVCES